MMKQLLEKFNYQGLFIKMFLVMVVSIVAVSVTITYSTIHMSEQLFMNTFSITNSKIMNHIKRSFETFSYSVALAANEVAQSGTIKNFLSQDNTDSLSETKLIYNTNLQMRRIHSNVDDYDVSITVAGKNGHSFSTNRAYWPISEEELAQHEITQKALKQPSRLLYQLDYDRNSTPMIIITKSLMERTTGSHYGTLYIAMKESEFKKFYGSYTSEGNDVMVLNAAGKIISSNQLDMIGQTSLELLKYAKEIEKENLDYKDIDFMNKKQIVITTYMPTIDMFIVNLIDKELVMKNLISTKTVVLISAAIVLVSLLVVFFISRRLTKSLTQLVKQISDMSKNNFDTYVTASGSYETKQLAHAFNYMLDELHDYVEELIQTQKKQRQAELEALQRQINPHFLYNTLTSVKIMVQQGNREKAADTINALISLLQNAVGNVNETVSIEEEVASLKSYVFINQVRYGNRINVSYFIAPDCINLQLPKLIIQPFIENSFFHAFNNKMDGYIHIFVQREKDILLCEVVDNGDGMDMGDGYGLPNSKQKRNLFSGIGVRNVNDRIKLLYGDNYGVHVSSQLEIGTHIKLVLPIMESKNSYNI